jgi:hypothetical protein
MYHIQTQELLNGTLLCVKTYLHVEVPHFLSSTKRSKKENCSREDAGRKLSSGTNFDVIIS